jgi:hypothetical protein
MLVPLETQQDALLCRRGLDERVPAGRRRCGTMPVRAGVSWRTPVAGEILSKAFLCRRGLDEGVPEIAHRKAAQQPHVADAALRRARSGVFWKLETTTMRSRSTGRRS